MASEHEAVVEALLGRPFSQTPYGGRDAFGDVDHHVLLLSATQDFWDDRSTKVVEAALRAIERERDTLAEALDARWGPAETVDLWSDGQSWSDHLGGGGPVDFLRGLAAEMRVWSCSGPDRWVALVIGQEDSELPFELFLAVGAGREWPVA